MAHAALASLKAAAAACAAQYAVAGFCPDEAAAGLLVADELRALFLPLFRGRGGCDAASGGATPRCLLCWARRVLFSPILPSCEPRFVCQWGNARRHRRIRVCWRRSARALSGCGPLSRRRYPFLHRHPSLRAASRSDESSRTKALLDADNIAYAPNAAIRCYRAR